MLRKIVNILLMISSLILLTGFSPAQSDLIPNKAQTMLNVQFKGTISGDVYINGKICRSGVIRVGCPVTAGTYTVTGKNITDLNIRNGDKSYYYSNVSTKVTVKAGRTKTVTLYPKKVYQNGFLKISCTFSRYKKSKDYPLAAEIFVDGTKKSECTPERKTVTLSLPPGKYSVRVVLKTGSPYRSSSYYKPTSMSGYATVVVGKTKTFTAKFSPK